MISQAHANVHCFYFFALRGFFLVMKRSLRRSLLHFGDRVIKYFSLGEFAKLYVGAIEIKMNEIWRPFLFIWERYFRSLFFCLGVASFLRKVEPIPGKILLCHDATEKERMQLFSSLFSPPEPFIIVYSNNFINGGK